MKHSLTFNPVDDAYIASDSSTSNYGSAATLEVDNSPIKHFLLKFDVTGVNGQSVVNTRVRLYNENPSTNIAGTTTYFVGNYYKVANGVVTKYYFASSQRIAMRKNGTLYFMFADHLGSTSLVTDADGYNGIETRYTAWGECAM